MIYTSHDVWRLYHNLCNQPMICFAEPSDKMIKIKMINLLFSSVSLSSQPLRHREQELWKPFRLICHSKLGLLFQRLSRPQLKQGSHSDVLHVHHATTRNTYLTNSTILRKLFSLIVLLKGILKSTARGYSIPWQIKSSGMSDRVK